MSSNGDSIENDNTAPASSNSNFNITSNSNNNETIPREFECALCLRLLLEPVSVSCGHTYCRSCIEASLDYRAACPLCREPIVAGRSVNVLIQTLIEEKFPYTLAERRREKRKELLEEDGNQGMVIDDDENDNCPECDTDNTSSSGNGLRQRFVTNNNGNSGAAAGSATGSQQTNRDNAIAADNNIELMPIGNSNSTVAVSRNNAVPLNPNGTPAEVRRNIPFWFTDNKSVIGYQQNNNHNVNTVTVTHVPSVGRNSTLITSRTSTTQEDILFPTISHVLTMISPNNRYDLAVVDHALATDRLIVTEVPQAIGYQSYNSNNNQSNDILNNNFTLCYLLKIEQTVPHPDLPGTRQVLFKVEDRVRLVRSREQEAAGVNGPGGHGPGPRPVQQQRNFNVGVGVGPGAYNILNALGNMEQNGPNENENVLDGPDQNQQQNHNVNDYNQEYYQNMNQNITIMLADVALIKDAALNLSEIVIPETNTNNASTAPGPAQQQAAVQADQNQTDLDANAAPTRLLNDSEKNLAILACECRQMLNLHLERLGHHDKHSFLRMHGEVPRLTATGAGRNASTGGLNIREVQRFAWYLCSVLNPSESSSSSSFGSVSTLSWQNLNLSSSTVVLEKLLWLETTDLKLRIRCCHNVLKSHFGEEVVQQLQSLDNDSTNNSLNSDATYGNLSAADVARIGGSKAPPLRLPGNFGILKMRSHLASLLLLIGIVVLLWLKGNGYLERRGRSSGYSWAENDGYYSDRYVDP